MSVEDLLEFQRMLGINHPVVPRELSVEERNDRVLLILEELTELFTAFQDDDMVKQADALIDLAYVTIGTATVMGLPWDLLWKEVHSKNMEKVPGQVSKRNIGFDAVKPEGWKPPDILGILESQGWKNSRR